MPLLQCNVLKVKLLCPIQDQGFSSIHLLNGYKMLDNTYSLTYHSHIDCKNETSPADLTTEGQIR